MILPVIVALLAQQVAPAADLSQPARTMSLRGTTHHVQGIDTDGVTLWVTSVDRSARKGYLMAFSLRDGSLEHSIDLADGERFHPGGVSLEGNSIWLPLAEYKPRSSSVVQRRNAKTLEVEFEFRVDDHIGCVAITPEYVIGGNWDSREFYVWDHKGVLIRKVTSTTGNSYQDLKWSGGFLVGSGTVASRRGAVDWLQGSDFKLSRRITVGETDRGQSYAREGMTIFRNELWFLPEDDQSRLFVFPLPR